LVERFAKEFKIGIPILIGETRTVFDRLQIVGIPKTIILDRQGRPMAWPITVSDEATLRTLLAAAAVKP